MQVYLKEDIIHKLDYWQDNSLPTILNQWAGLHSFNNRLSIY
jgi:hypothetical protein